MFLSCLVFIPFIHIFNSQQITNTDINLNSTNTQLKNLNNSDQKWVDSIKESTKNDTVKLFFTRNASLVFQQSMLSLIYMIDQYNSSKQNTHFSFFIDEKVYNEQKFDFSFINSNQDKIDLIKNYKDLTNSNNFNQSYDTTPTSKMLDLVLNNYKNRFKDQLKFDIWIPEISLQYIWENHYEGFYHILPYTNKIYLLSDGNAQTFSFVYDYIKYIKSINYNEQTAIENLNKLRDKNLNSNPENLKLYQNSSLFEFVKNESFFTLFHITDYSKSPYYELQQNLRYNSYRFNFDYQDMSNKLFESNQQINKTNYINQYEKFFKINGGLLSSFVYKGFEYYNPKKKNIIWMGDSLIRGNNNINKQRKEELQNVFLAFTKKYNPNEYNYFFKHHPRYSYKQQEELTNFITKKNKINAIYFSNFPWELFLAWDKASNNRSYNSFFNFDSNKETIPKTQLIGIQYTSSVIMSTFSFISAQYQMDVNEAWKSTSIANFPILGTMEIIRPTDATNLNYDETVIKNKREINKSYLPFVELGYFPNYEKSQINSSEFLDNFLDKKDIKNNENPFLYLYILLPILFFVLASIITFAIIFIHKNKKNKLTTQK